MVVRNRYCRPCSLTRPTISKAIAPVAAEITAGRAPEEAITTAMENEAYNPILGSTPAMIEKAIASGISASATTSPESTSPRTLKNHCWLQREEEVMAVREGGTIGHSIAWRAPPSP